MSAKAAAAGAMPAASAFRLYSLLSLAQIPDGLRYGGQLRRDLDSSGPVEVLIVHLPLNQLQFPVSQHGYLVVVRQVRVAQHMLRVPEL
jgi:hypothetical protein